MQTMNDLAIKHGTDKNDGHHGYASIYDAYFTPFRDLQINMLEIGVKHGASVKMFEEYFPAGKITGIDILQKCKAFASDRIDILIGDQKNRDFILDVGNDSGPFDIIIDDGGHKWSQQIKSFQWLWYFLKPGGLYVVEDLHTSYMVNPAYSQYHDFKLSAVDYFKTRIDDMNFKHELGIAFIHFYKSLVILKKDE